MYDGSNDNRYGVITDLAVQLQEREAQQFGKTALQKLIFLLQEVYKVDMGYHFGFYTYGPFAAELLNDLDFAQCIGAVTIESADPAAGSGYRIQAGLMATDTMERASKFLTEHRGVINSLLDSFGKKSAKELELLTTIIYLNKEVKPLDISQSDAIRWIRELKPRFTEHEVQSAIRELTTRHGIDLSFAA